MTRALTREELLALPAVTDIVTAGRALGLGRTLAHELARRGQFPVPVLRAGRVYRVPTARLLELLAIDAKPLPTTTGSAPTQST